MKKATFDFISQGLEEYILEEHEAEMEVEAKIKAKMEAKIRARIKAETACAWKEHDAIFKMECDSAWQERATVIHESNEMDEAVLYVKYMARNKVRGSKRRRAAVKAKHDAVKVATDAVRGKRKSEYYDDHWSYKLLSLSKSIRGNHDVFKSRTVKAERLIKRAEKLTGGKFDRYKVD